MEEGVSIADTALREIREETGLAAVNSVQWSGTGKTVKEAVIGN